MQVRAARSKTSAAAIAANIAAEGYDSDEEVYATAKALAAEGAEGQEDEDVAAKVCGAGTYLLHVVMAAYCLLTGGTHCMWFVWKGGTLDDQSACQYACCRQRVTDTDWGVSQQQRGAAPALWHHICTKHP